MSLAEHFSINLGEKIIEEVLQITREWNHFANEYGVSDLSRKTIAKRLQEIEH